MGEDISPYVETIRRRMARETRRREQLVERSGREIESLVTDFRKIDPDIRKIVLFGSLATQTVRSSSFDIDLAVDCTRTRYLEIVSRALDSPYSVDVVEMVAAPKFIRDSVERYGQVLYER